MDLLKQEKGSITLFVLISMLFFVMFLTGMYMLSATAESGVIEEQARIKEIYEQGVNNIDEVYATLENDSRKYLKDVAKPGDYVAYDPTAGVTDENLLTYTSQVGTGMSHGNGCSKTDDGIDLSKGQTFTANSDIKWRVLSIDKETGEVVLISEEPIGTDTGKNFYMNGAIGYLYVEQELNEICKIYGYGKGANASKEFKYETGDIVEGLDEGTIKGSGARSININDINSITGYKHSIGTAISNTIFYPTKATSTGKSELAVKRSYADSFYTYTGSSYIDVNSSIYKILFGDKDTKEFYYWLASRAENIVGNATGFWIRAIYGEIVCEYITINTNNEGFQENSYGMGGVRPIVYLKSNVQTTRKDENGAWIIEE